MMEDDAEGRLPTALWIDAHIRQCTANAIPVYVMNKGAYASGTVMLKIDTLNDGVQVLSQMRDIDGKMGWMDVFDGKTVDEQQANEYIQRAIDRDPDLWVIEIESRDKTNPFEGKVF